ncbi:hypothetical protein [Streptomyces sp. NPDC001933]|uniref:hypothetical protein n=1 Tax=Streptomyces sp. NPDC001933 TaxID=3364626 RepID=UPI0036A11D7B
MDELLVALVAAGAALAGSAVTGFFAVRAAERQAGATRDAAQRQADAAWASAQRQADAAWASAQRQADAQLEVLREGHQAQEISKRRELRRQAYVEFLNRVDQLVAAPTTDQRAASGIATEFHDRVEQALNIVRLEGPAYVIPSAEEVARRPGDAAKRDSFLEAAREALNEPLRPPAPPLLIADPE